MKMRILFFFFALITVNCQEQSKVKIEYPEGDKILYSEYVNEFKDRLFLFSIDEWKEYEIPLEGIQIHDIGGKFSPDGKKILVKGKNYTDDIYIYDLRTSNWQKIFLPALNHPGENSCPFFDFLDDSTVVFDGLFNFLIISLKTGKLIDNLADTATFYISSFDTNRDANLLYLNVGPPMAGFNNIPMNFIVYNYKKREFFNYIQNTGYFRFWIKGTSNLFIISDLSFLNIETGEKSFIEFKNIPVDSIIYAQSKFIDRNRFLILKEEYTVFENDFYLYDFTNNSIKRLTYSRSNKTLMDVYNED
jgi:hypothetical protein